MGHETRNGVADTGRAFRAFLPGGVNVHQALSPDAVDLEQDAQHGE